MNVSALSIISTNFSNEIIDFSKEIDYYKVITEFNLTIDRFLILIIQLRLKINVTLTQYFIFDFSSLIYIIRFNFFKSCFF